MLNKTKYIITLKLPYIIYNDRTIKYIMRELAIFNIVK